MYERAMTFVEYVAFYGLSRSEGLVLRYLADAYKGLRQTVPEDARTEELSDLIEWLGELVRQVDSSLIDEWEKLRSGVGALVDVVPPAVTRNVRAFRVLARNALFRLVELCALRRYEELASLAPDVDWVAMLDAYYAEHDSIGIGPDARGPAFLILDERPDRWLLRQIFDDPADDRDWGITAEVDLAESDEAGVAVVHVTQAGQL
jgi:hypothetical protein